MSDLARTPPQLGAALRNRRRALGLTQSALAETAGTTQYTVSRIENGDPGVKLATLLDVIAALDLELAVRPRGKGAASDIEAIF